LLPKNLQNPKGEIRIKIGHRFIGEEHLGFLEESPSQRRPLLFAPGNLHGASVNAGGQPQVTEQFESLGAIRDWKAGNRAPPRVSSETSAKHVVKERSISDEQKILKDNTQTLAKVGRRVSAALCALEGNLSL
jgi:hypothetical protein